MALITAVAVVGMLLLLWLVSTVVQQARTDQPGRPYGPVKWFLLFSSGAKLDLLRRCPTDEIGHVGLGSAVVITAAMGTFASSIALAVALEGQAGNWPRYLPAGLGYGTIIFLIDRFLVSIQLNPYRVDGNAGRFRTFWNIPLVFVRVIPRLLLAVVIGFLIAEPILLVIFDSEVETRVAQTRTQIVRDAEARAEASRVEVRSRQRAMLDANLDGVDDYQAVQDELTELTDQINKTERELGDKRTLRSAEQLPGRTEFTLSNGERRVTSGESGCGPICRSIEREITDLETQLRQQRSRREDLIGQRDRMSETVTASEEQVNDEKQADLEEIDAQLQEETDAAQNTAGLLIRIDALEHLAQDDTPFGGADDADETDGTGEGKGTGETDEANEPNETGEPRESADTGGSTDSVDSGDTDEAETEDTTSSQAAATGLAGLTTLGKVIWLVRGFLVLVDTMPVLFKLMLSLRRRRPYDELVAEQEEYAHAESADRVEAFHAGLAAEKARRAAERARAGQRNGQRIGAVPAGHRPWRGGQPPWLMVTSPSGNHAAQPGEQVRIGRGPDATLRVDDPRLSGNVGITIEWKEGTGWVASER